MRMWFTKAIGFVLFSLIVVMQLVAPVAVLAQEEDPETEDVGGVTIEIEDIHEAIEAPTPNLANTTAYVLVTISTMLVESVNPQKLVRDNAESTVYRGGSSLANNYPRDMSEALAGNGLLGGVAFLTAETFAHPPASGTEYVAYLIRQSPLTPEPVYAQEFGVGFGALSPILGTWAAFRDIAYFLLTVMFLVTGLLIIFRKKVSGNVAVSVQNALPRLVITLLLITFSYAIAGFIVDLMFWAIYFVVFIFSGLFASNEIPFTNLKEILGLGEKTGPTLAEFALDTNIFTILFQYVISGGANNAAEGLSSLVFKSLQAVPILGGVAKALSPLGFVVELIFQLVIGIAILVQVFRVFFQLLMSYAGFVINVVLSPFILLQGAIPGKDPFKKWIMSLIGGLAPFVVVVFMLFMAFVLAGQNTKPGIGYNAENPPQYGLRLPLILTKEVDAASFIGILSVGFVMLLPEAVGMVKKVTGAGPFDEYKDKAFNNFAKGWKGGEVVPGLGFTKVPGAERFAFGDKESRAKAQKEGRGFAGQRYGLIGGGLSLGKSATIGTAQYAGKRAMQFDFQNALVNRRIRPSVNEAEALASAAKPDPRARYVPTGPDAAIITGAAPSSTAPPIPLRTPGSKFGRKNSTIAPGSRSGRR
jgi:hypothetical protein